METIQTVPQGFKTIDFCIEDNPPFITIALPAQMEPTDHNISLYGKIVEKK